MLIFVSLATPSPERKSGQLSEQVVPAGIGRFDQPQLSVAVPLLDPAFAKPRFLQIVMAFIPDQKRAVVFAGKSFDRSRPAL
jgi:hypothetical protein